MTASACPPLVLPADMPTAALDSDTSLLRASLYPLPVDEFKQDYWRRKAVAIVGAGSARVEQLIAEELCGLNVKEMMAASASEQIFVWMKERPTADTAAASATSASSLSSSLAKQPITSFPLDNPNQLDAAIACYNSGSSLYFRSPPSLAHQFVRAFNAAVGFNFAGLDYSSTSASSQPKGEIEVFVSRAGHHTGFHCDFMDNFTIQLRGKKTWTFGAVDVQYPVRGFTPHYKDRSTDEMQYKTHSACQGGPYTGTVPLSGDQVTLSAGDVLYHPAGIWHAVSCDEDSISINISLIATTAADLISDAVRQLLWRSDAGRAGLCGTHEQMQEQLREALTQLQANIAHNQLTEQLILPAAMMAPRRRQPVTIDAEVDKQNLQQIPRPHAQSTYHTNPLITITPHRGGEEEAEDEDEAEGDEDAESTAAEGLDERKEGDDGPDDKDEAQYAHYVLHHLFGNESVDSAMRTVLRVHSLLVYHFDRIVELGSLPSAAFDWSDLHVEAADESVDRRYADHDVNFTRCLFVLHELGYLREK